MVGCSKDRTGKVMRDVVERDGSRLAWVLKDIEVLDPEVEGC